MRPSYHSTPFFLVGAGRVCLLFALATLLGCGQPAPPANVVGTLRINGQPVGNCLITFLPESGSEGSGPHSTGVTDEQGYFRLRWPDQREGAALGWHRVIVQDLSVSAGIRRQDHGTVDAEMDNTPLPPARQSRVPQAYNSLEYSPFRHEVRRGPQVIDLDMRSFTAPRSTAGSDT